MSRSPFGPTIPPPGRPTKRKIRKILICNRRLNHIPAQTTVSPSPASRGFFYPPHTPSIQRLIPPFPPEIKHLLCLPLRRLLKDNPPLLHRHPDLLINERIIKPGRRRLLPRSRVYHPVRPRPIDRPQAHRTRLTRSIQNTIRQLVMTQLQTGIPDR